MKILTVGFLVFICWASLSSYIYVCKMNGWCNVGTAVLTSVAMPNDASAVDLGSNAVSDSSLQALDDSMKDVTAAIPELLFVRFEFDISTFQPDLYLHDFYDASTAYMGQNSESVLIITGHTDAIGSDAYNQSLGYRRAQSVLNYFESRGVAAARIKIDSKGEKEPIETNRTGEGRAINRRASVLIENQ